MELRSGGQPLLGGNATERHVRSFVIVGPEPFGGGLLHLLDALEQVLAEPVVAHSAVVALDIGVLLRLAGLDVFDTDTVLPRPGHEGAADEL